MLTQKCESIAMELKKQFGRRLRYLRLMARLTQAQLAEAADLSTTQLGYIEQGRSATSFQAIEKFAVALKCHPRDLFDFPWPGPDTGRDFSTGK